MGVINTDQTTKHAEIETTMTGLSDNDDKNEQYDEVGKQEKGKRIKEHKDIPNFNELSVEEAISTKLKGFNVDGTVHNKGNNLRARKRDLSKHIGKINQGLDFEFVQHHDQPYIIKPYNQENPKKLTLAQMTANTGIRKFGDAVRHAIMRSFGSLRR